MSKVILYIAQTVDGYIADKDGGIHWLEAFNSPDEDYGYKTMYARIGAVIMGGVTYRQVLTFGDWVYPGIMVYVVTRQGIGTPPVKEVEAYQSGDMPALVNKIRAETDKDIWLVGGGQIIAEFIKHDLIDEYQIATMPLLLGEGLPLFPPVSIGAQQNLKLVESKTYPNSIVNTMYIRER